MDSLLASKLQTALMAIVVLTLFCVGLLPLFGGPSYEFSLACGVVLPLFGGVFNALDAAQRGALPEQAFVRGLASGARLCGLALGIALLHGLRVGFCEPWPDLAYFALGPVPGALLACAWGALCGAFAVGSTRVRLVGAALLAVAAPIAGIVLSLARYYTSPIIFAFDHFFGFFSGILYDTIIDGTERLLTYRVGTLAWGCVLYAVSVAVYRGADGSLRTRVRGRRRAVGAGVLGAVVGLLLMVNGSALGHFQTVASIRQELGHVARSERCEVVYASGIAQRDAHALARDCDGHIREQEEFFEQQGPALVTVYLFASGAQKAYLMGARDVYIAKPWRNEIYIQARSYPHPVLGHELAHVMAGQFASGPFRVAGPLGGWIPDPGRIEGVAVAASPRQGDELSLLEWARAMQQEKLLPPLESIFRLGFLGQNSSKAYTVAGAFLHWLRQAHGIAAVKAWYGGATLMEATGESLAELEAAFHAHLEGIDVRPEVMQVAKARFERPPVFARRCPHQVDAVVGEARHALARFDPEGAEAHYRDVLSMDPNNFTARTGLGECAFRRGELDRATKAYRELEQDTQLSTLQRAMVLERLGDLAFFRTQLSTANTHYAQAEELIVDQDHARTLEVKRVATGKLPAPELARKSVQALLIGRPLFGTDWSLAAVTMGRWAEAVKDDGLAEYLVARNLATRGRWEEASTALDQALSQGLSTPLVKAEALRTRVHLACALGQRQVVQEGTELYLKERSPSGARRAELIRFARRCGAEVVARVADKPEGSGKKVKPDGVKQK